MKNELLELAPVKTPINVIANKERQELEKNSMASKDEDAEDDDEEKSATYYEDV